MKTNQYLLLLSAMMLSVLGFGQTGTGVVFETDASYAFAATTVDSTSSFTFEVINDVGAEQTIYFSALDAPFSLVDNSPLVIAANDTASVTLQFQPTELGSFSGSLEAAGSVFGSATLNFSGEGIQVVLEWDVDSLNFETTALGQSSSLDVVFTNVGDGVAELYPLNDPTSVFTIDFIDTYEPPTLETCLVYSNTEFYNYYLTVDLGSDPGNTYWYISDNHGYYSYGGEYASGADSMELCLPWGDSPNNPMDVYVNFFNFGSGQDASMELMDGYGNVVWSLALGGNEFYEYNDDFFIPIGVPPSPPLFEAGVIPEGGSQTARVNFEPINSGLVEGGVTLLTNSPVASEITLICQGEGISEISGELCDLTWSATNSPYSFTGEIDVPEGCDLFIEPGTVINANGYQLNIDGNLYANGNNVDSILWNNASIVLTTDSAEFSFCSFQSPSEGENNVLCGMNEEFDFTSTIEEFIVPCTGNYRITAVGARGGVDLTGFSIADAGRGAIMAGDFFLVQGEILQILVGGQGEDYTDDAGGGGGTFVIDENGPLIIAGGGGGVNSGLESWRHANASEEADAGENSQYGVGSGGYGNGDAGGGASYDEDGQAGLTPARSFLNGGSGGTGSNVSGGFGGGGGSDGGDNGGGGGYSGGNIGNTCASGGGSYNSGTNQENLDGASNSLGLDNGLVSIQSLDFDAVYLPQAMIVGSSEHLIFENNQGVDIAVSLTSQNSVDVENVHFEVNGVFQMGSYGDVVISQSTLTLDPSESNISYQPTVSFDGATVLDSVSFIASGNIEFVAVPPLVTSAYVVARGAQGGNSCGNPGGYGAHVEGYIDLMSVTELKVLVGGEAPDVNDAAGGGGGTFLATGDDIPLIVAGGGSGATCSSNGNPGRISESGGDGDSCENSGGVNGNGGNEADGNCSDGAGGGGGFYTDGGLNSSYGEQRGYAFVNGGAGGYSVSGGANGGFGGGAGTHNSNTGGGAGGGYSGGGAPFHGNGYSGGGGGSYGANGFDVATEGANSGNGSLTIYWLAIEGSNTPLISFANSFEIVGENLSFANVDVTSAETMQFVTDGLDINASIFEGDFAMFRRSGEIAQVEVMEVTGKGMVLPDSVHVAVSHSAFGQSESDGIRVGDYSEVNIEHSIFRENQGSGVSILGENSELMIRNSIINGNNIAVSVEGAADMSYLTIASNGTALSSTGLFSQSLTNSIIAFNASTGSIPVVSDFNYIGASPYFAEGGYYLEEFSPCADAAMPWHNDQNMPYGIGGLRADMGAYGGPDNAGWGGDPAPSGSAALQSVADTPQDQGYNVGLTFDASAFDNSIVSDNISHYAIWRHFDPTGEPIESLSEGNWELLGTMPAQGFSGYAYQAEALGNSNTFGDFSSCYTVVAHTDDEDVYWYSNVSCGESVDNLAPDDPDLNGLVLETGEAQISWSVPTEEDYDYTEIFNDDGFSAEVGTDTLVVDAAVQEGNSYTYTAINYDVNGNASDPSTITLNIPAGLDIIPLTAGWNLISTDRTPTDASIEAVFATLEPGNLDYITGFDGGVQFYDPEGLSFLNSLSALTNGQGYWVRVAEDDTLEVSGASLQANYLPALNAGWNIIGFPNAADAAPADYFADFITDGSLEYVTGFDGGSTYFDPNGLSFLNSLTALENGLGYWVKVTEAFDPNGMVLTGDEPTAALTGASQQHANPNFMLVNGTSDLTHAAGTQVEVRRADGSLVAQLPVLEGGYLMTTALFGDDPSTDAIEGLQVGEELHFEVQGQRAEQSLVYSGQMDIKHLELTFGAAQAMASIFPNPFVESLQVSAVVETPGYLMCELTDAVGKVVAQQPMGWQAKGAFNGTWEVPGLAPGMYTCKILKDDEVLLTTPVLKR